MFIWKQYPENFAFLILRIIELLKFVNFLKSRLIFNIFYYFQMFVNKLFPYLTWANLRKIKICFNVKFSTYYFHVKTYILAEFQICISVPLNINENPYIINQVSDDSLDPVEKCINLIIKYNFIQAYYLSKIGLRFEICFHSML